MASPMDLLRSNLSRVRIPEPTTRIFKQECCVSFDTPKSEGGLFVDMNSFLAFGKEFVDWNFGKTGNPVYLHIKQTRKLVSEDRPLKKPTLLAIGIDGGFDNGEPEYEEAYSIVILPGYISLPFPSVELPEKVRLAVDAILLAEGAERKEQVAAWVAEKKQVSQYATNLQQIDNGVVVPPSGWKCSKCDKTENLWLNLTDGMILCGRRNWDGTGGNNHAVEHYKETGYPLAVKLGTITADLEGAVILALALKICEVLPESVIPTVLDMVIGQQRIPRSMKSNLLHCGSSDVFSYPEDEGVLDPHLAQHLAFFGIDFSSLQKTEMTTAERELDQNTNFDWNRIQESGQEVEPLFGPGYTGLANLGNSCYMAATMQVVFSTHSFCARYYMNQSLKLAFERAPADPTVDLNMQLTKLAHGLLSGKYSIPVPEKDDDANVSKGSVSFLAKIYFLIIQRFIGGNPKFASGCYVRLKLLELTSTGRKIARQEGIRPRMFKAVIAASHPEFSSMRQQDALEFFQHFLDQVERAHAGNLEDPSRSFKFGIEDRISCPSGKVTYSRRLDNILSLNIPLHEATNKAHLEAFYKLKAQKVSEGKEVSSDQIVRPRVPLEACLANFSAPEEVQDFYSSALKSKTTAIKTAGLTSFPDYLVLHMRKFVMEEGWVPKKLDVYIDVPDVIDISHMRSNGLQPGEELLPEVAEDEVGSTKLVANEDIVAQLVSMGFNYLHCQKAAIRTSNAGVEEAMNWLLTHMDDADIDIPISEADVTPATASSTVDQSKVDTLVSFGFSEELARKALKASGGDIEKATDWIFSNPDPSASSDVNATTSNSTSSSSDAGLPDGGGRYKLIGLVSHIGTSTHCGHYVAHILKDGRWVIFNDQKVGASVNPPKDMGYLYFFERLNS